MVNKREHIPLLICNILYVLLITINVKLLFNKNISFLKFKSNFKSVNLVKFKCPFGWISVLLLIQKLYKLIPISGVFK